LFFETMPKWLFLFGFLLFYNICFVGANIFTICNFIAKDKSKWGNGVFIRNLLNDLLTITKYSHIKFAISLTALLLRHYQQFLLVFYLIFLQVYFSPLIPEIMRLLI